MLSRRERVMDLRGIQGLEEQRNWSHHGGKSTTSLRDEHDQVDGGVRDSVGASSR
jgi:hypothetical protein